MHQNDHPTKSGPTKNHSSCTSAKQERMKVHLSSRKNKRSSQKREKARFKKKKKRKKSGRMEKGQRFGH